MELSTFIAVGENIHCTRIHKVGGKYVKPFEGGHVIEYPAADGTRRLPVPEEMTRTPDWESGRVKHCAVAIAQGCYGSGDAQAAGKDYLQSLARRQEAAGAAYLDINVDEFSTDIEERARLMQWTVALVQEAVSIPVSVDSSNLEILRAGLSAADPAKGRPLVNSVSLERTDILEAAREFNAVVIASAAGETGMPTTAGERVENLQALMPRLRDIGLDDAAIHIDPLVFPVSVDPQNGVRFLDAVRAVREAFGSEVHIVAGLSNISFGMPSRRLINQVFTCLAVEAGADGGIVDPFQISAEIIRSMDTDSEDFKLARAMLMGEDEYGMEFIMAARDGRLS